MAVANAKDLLLLTSEEDFDHEEEILRNPYAVKTWWRYLESKKYAPRAVRFLIYERALKVLPGSYKLWFHYLTDRVKYVKKKCITDPAWENLNNIFERCLVFMSKMPRIWQEYLSFLTLQKTITKTRRTFDRALCSLPITQHDKIWKLYTAFVRQPFVPAETAVRVYRRYIKVEPGHMEEYIDFLISAGYIDEAASRLADLVNDDSYVSIKGKTNHEMWIDLCNLITRNAAKIKTLKVEAILRAGISKFSSEVGQLWCSLADYYIRMAHFEKALDVFEEGMTTVTTVRDFSQVFDACAQFEESMITAKMESMSTNEKQKQKDEAGGKKKQKKSKKKKDEAEQEDSSNNNVLDFTDDDDLALRLARLEYLMDRRPELVSSVLLRQNPHNVHEWHKRAKLFEAANDPEKVVITYSEAVQTVDPHKALGKPHTLWVSFAKFYESHDDLESARAIFERGVKTTAFTHTDDLAAVWCEYAEMELRHQNADGALKLMQRATTRPRHVSLAAKQQELAEVGEKSDGVPVQDKVYKNIKLWSFYVDLEESIGTMTSTRAVYDRLIDLRIATPQIIINYAHFLEEHKFFEDSFQAYEKGVNNLFEWPFVYDIWMAYLTKFVDRYSGKKLERARDLFEQALEKCPGDLCKNIFLLYAKLEEDYGLARHAMAVYDRATKAVPDADRLEMYNVYISRATEMFGVTKTREIYERAIETLPDAACRTMCLRLAELERKLGEIDRARAVFVHCSQFCDPTKTSLEQDPDQFWDKWHQFEVAHGNPDTYKDMLRIKRSVQALLSSSSIGAQQMVAAAADRKRARHEENKRTATAAAHQAQQEAAMERAHSAREAAAVSAAPPVAIGNDEEIGLE